MQRGIDQESTALECFNKMHGYNCKPAVYEHDDIPYMGASLDGYDEETKVLVEIKCSQKLFDMACEEIIPEYYIAQCQHQLEVMGLDSMFYVVYVEHEIKVIAVHKDEGFVKNLVMSELEFWDNLVNMNEPALTDKDYVKVTDEAFLSVATEYRMADVNYKAAKAKREVARSALLSFGDGGSFQGFGVKATKLADKTITDYKQYCIDQHIEVTELKPYEVYRPGTYRITLSKTELTAR